MCPIFAHNIWKTGVASSGTMPRVELDCSSSLETAVHLKNSEYYKGVINF